MCDRYGVKVVGMGEEITVRDWEPAIAQGVAGVCCETRAFPSSCRHSIQENANDDLALHLRLPSSMRRNVWMDVLNQVLIRGHIDVVNSAMQRRSSSDPSSPTEP